MHVALQSEQPSSYKLPDGKLVMLALIGLHSVAFGVQTGLNLGHSTMSCCEQSHCLPLHDFPASTPICMLVCMQQAVKNSGQFS